VSSKILCRELVLPVTMFLYSEVFFMYCPECGVKQPYSDVNFCFECGAHLQAQEKLQSEAAELQDEIVTTQQRERISLSPVFTILLLLVVGGLVVWYSSSSPTSVDSSIIPTPILVSELTGTVTVTPEGTPGSPREMFTITNLNFRSAPSTTAEVYEIIPIGVGVMVKEIVDNASFDALEFNGRSGFVMKKYLSSVHYNPLDYTGVMYASEELAMLDTPRGEQVETADPGDEFKTNSSLKRDGFIHAYFSKKSTFGWVEESVISKKSPLESISLQTVYGDPFTIAYLPSLWLLERVSGQNILHLKSNSTCNFSLGAGGFGFEDSGFQVIQKDVNYAGIAGKEMTLSADNDLLYWISSLNTNDKSYIFQLQWNEGVAKNTKDVCITQSKKVLLHLAV